VAAVLGLTAAIVAVMAGPAGEVAQAKTSASSPLCVIVPLGNGLQIEVGYCP
jgi:hypothetical protein